MPVDHPGPKAGDVIVWALTTVAGVTQSYLIFRQGRADDFVHIEGRHVWGRVFAEAKRFAAGRPVWLREGLGQPWRLINGCRDPDQPGPASSHA